MIRLFTEEKLFENQTIILPEKQAHYVRNVMRLKEGENIALFNGIDGEWLSHVFYEGKKQIRLVVQEQIRQQEDLSKVILCFAIIKKENVDLILQKATELGVTEIYPMITDRTVVRGFNMERAKLILTEAAEQCERLSVPILYEPMKLSAVLKSLPTEYTPIYLAERSETTQKLSQDIIPAFLIGPEGGFSSTENQLLLKHQNIKTVHLGQTILRAETAALAVLSAWQFRLFD